MRNNEKLNVFVGTTNGKREWKVPKLTDKDYDEWVKLCKEEIEKIEEEILGYSIEKDVIEVEFDDYILELDLEDMKEKEINKKNIAEAIFTKQIAED